MRFAVIENGLVTNVIEADEAFVPDDMKLVRDEAGEAMIGGAWTGHGFAPPEEPALSPEQARARRAAAYRDEADPLFFKWQRGEVDRDEWLAKVEEIKARFPKG